MIKIKKIIVVYFIIIFLNSCGYVPIYSKKIKVEFYIENISYAGDKELSNFIDTNLINYSNKNNGQKFQIEAEIRYIKDSISKNSAGKIEEYSLIADAVFIVKSEKSIQRSENTFDKLVFSETFIMSNFKNEFEETEYERSIKQNMARLITSKLILQLARLNVN
jgi:hypothetical protein